MSAAPCISWSRSTPATAMGSRPTAVSTHLKKKDTPNIYFAGNGLSGDAMQEIFDLIGDDDFSVNVISKSGTTTEPAVAPLGEEPGAGLIGGQDLDLLALGVEVVPGGGVLPGGVAGRRAQPDPSGR